MLSIFNPWLDIKDFHEKFCLPSAKFPMLLHDELFTFRYKFLQEELDEFVDAHKRNDLHDAADALVDLVYVALGTAYLMGIPFDKCWNAVHVANMLKIRAKTVDDSKRSSTYDVVKPEGWQKPDLCVYLTNGNKI